MRNPLPTAVEKATVSSPLVGVIPCDGLTGLATEALYVVTLRVTVTSENGRAVTEARTGTEVPFKVQEAVFGTVTVAFALST